MSELEREFGFTILSLPYTLALLNQRANTMGLPWDSIEPIIKQVQEDMSHQDMYFVQAHGATCGALQAKWRQDWKKVSLSVALNRHPNVRDSWEGSWALVPESAGEGTLIICADEAKRVLKEFLKVRLPVLVPMALLEPKLNLLVDKLYNQGFSLIRVVSDDPTGLRAKLGLEHVYGPIRLK